MGEFLTTLRTEQISEATSYSRAKYKLTDALVYESTSLGGLIVVPGGFITDFASVPRVPIAYLVTGGLGNSAACLHDFLYSDPHLPMKNSCEPVTREEANRVLRGAIIDGMSFNLSVNIFDSLKSIYFIFISYAMYVAIRTLSARHWANHLAQ